MERRGARGATSRPWCASATAAEEQRIIHPDLEEALGGCRSVRILRVELAAPQWPKAVAANEKRAALHLFAAGDAHGAGRARRD
jgi:hypothetical protein